MSLIDLGKPKKRMDLNSSIDYLLGEKPLIRKRPRQQTGTKRPTIEVVKYHIELSDMEKVVLGIEAVLVIWFILAKLKILPIF